MAGRLFAVVAIVLASLAPAARADTIAQYVGGTNGYAVGNSPFGQSVTTPTGGPWTNLSFNFYVASTSNPYAIGNLYLLNQAYAGTPASLSPGTAGYIARAAASGGTSWVFSASVTLQPSTTYYFYMDSPNTDHPVGWGSSYTGGNLYVAVNGSAYSPESSNDMNFTLSGTSASPGPLPGSGLLSYLVLGFGGAAAFRRRLRARAAALLTSLKRSSPRLKLWSQYA